MVRKKRKRPAKPMKLHDRIKAHVETTERLLALIERCAALRGAAKIAQARKLFKQVERLNETLLELEDIGPRLH
jgi:hypothetical protein